MAKLNDADRAELQADWMREGRGAFPENTLKAECRGVVNAVDDWIEANQASFNQALPLKFRQSATLAQKARALQRGIMRRVRKGVN